MDLRRFGLILLLSAAGLLGVAWYVNAQQAQRAASQPARASQAAPEAVDNSAPDKPAPAATASSPAPVAASLPAAPAAGPSTLPAAGPLEEAAPATAQSARGSEIVPKFYYGPNPHETFLLGSLEPKEFPFQVEVCRQGAAVRTVKLAGYFATDADKRLYEKDPAGYEEARQANPRRYHGHYSLLNPVENIADHGAKQYLPLSAKSLGIEILSTPRQSGDFDLDDIPWVKVPRSESATQVAEESITFACTFVVGAESDEKPVVRLLKTYTVRRDDYSLRMALTVENLSQEPLRIRLDQLGPVGVPRDDPRADDRKLALSTLADDKVKVALKPTSDLSKAKLSDWSDLGRNTGDAPVLWIGETNRIFASMMYLTPSEPGKLVNQSAKADYSMAAVEGAATSGRTFVTRVSLPDIQLKPGQKQEMSFDIFAGPKKRDLFQQSPLYSRLDYLKTIETGSCCSFSPLTLGMMWLLGLFSKISFGNYGVAIILLVALVRLVLHPLTKKGQVAMSRMQKMGPEMQKLREKYKDDKDTLNKEMVKLYKTQGGTPILGCLPMLLQMPIWVALWTALSASVELRHAAFLPFWITDLSAPDVVYRWAHAVNIPLIGGFMGPIDSLNLLPLLLTVAMYLQTKLTPQMTGPTTTADQAKQQKIMAVMMPAMMLLFFYNAPSGLTLYIMTSTAAGVVEQYVIRRHIRQREAAAAAAETMVVAPGKAARSQRARKPRGPFWKR